MLKIQAQPCFQLQEKLVLMGVAGCGKSSVGEELARCLHVRYLDGDCLHPLSNIEKMKQGIPLTDEDRWPWLAAVGSVLKAPSAVLIIGCSALKKAIAIISEILHWRPFCLFTLPGTGPLSKREWKRAPGILCPPACCPASLRRWKHRKRKKTPSALTLTIRFMILFTPSSPC